MLLITDYIDRCLEQKGWWFVYCFNFVYFIVFISLCKSDFCYEVPVFPSISERGFSEQPNSSSQKNRYNEMHVLVLISCKFWYCRSQSIAKCSSDRKGNKEKVDFKGINSINVAINIIRTHAERKEVWLDDLDDSTRENEPNNSFNYN